MKLTTEEKISIFLGLYVAAIIATNLIGGKLTILFGKGLSVAILALPITYVILSATNEVFGQRLSIKYVLSAIISQITVLIILIVALWLPQGPREILPGFTEAYQTVFQVSGRIIVGSIVAFLVSQYYTIRIFNIIKQKTEQKFAWLRYNLATISGQLIDTFLFMFIAFYNGNVEFIFNIALTYFLFKALAAIISTPFFYGGVWWLRTKSIPPEEPIKIAVQIPQKHKPRIH